jgi:hypothetical protein
MTSIFGVVCKHSMTVKRGGDIQMPAPHLCHPMFANLPLSLSSYVCKPTPVTVILCLQNDLPPAVILRPPKDLAVSHSFFILLRLRGETHCVFTRQNSQILRRLQDDIDFRGSFENIG